jgi:iron complex outermembrane receptor protein
MPATSITGVVADHNGTGLPGATVTLSGPVARTATSGEHGLFRLGGLPPGDYTLTASLYGFAEAGTTLTVEEGSRSVVELRLEHGAYEGAIEVVSASPQEGLAASEVLESPGREMSEALTRIAGMSRVRKGGVASDIVLRAYQGENLNVLVDGVKVYGACPNNMDPPAFHTDLSEVERVEIGKGPFDIKNAGSLGGVVNIVTRAPQPGLTVAPSVSVGSFGFLNPSVTISQSGTRASVQAGLSYRESRPYADGDGDAFTSVANYRPGTEDTDAYRIGAGWLRLGWQPAESHSLQLAVARQEADHVLYPYLMMDAVYDDTDRLNLNYAFTPYGSSLESLRVQAYASRVEHWMTDEWRLSSTGVPREYAMATDAETGSAGLKLEADFGSWRAGVEGVRRSWLAETSMAGAGYMAQSVVPDVATTTAGAYAESAFALSSRWSLETGARFDWSRSEADPERANTNLYFAYKDTTRTEASDAFPSAKVRAVYAAGPGVELSAGIGHTVRVPDAQERFFALRRMGTDWVGNPELGPVRNTGVNLSGRVTSSGVKVDATLFWDEVDDFITVHEQARVNMVPGVMNPRARSYAATDATMRGAELSVVAGLGERLFVTVDASAVRASKEERPEQGILSSNVVEIPPYSARAAFRYELGKGFGEIEGVFAARQDRVDTDLEEQPTPGYGVANLRAGARLGWLQLTVAVYNLLDRQYVEHLSYQRDPFRSGTRVPEPGRSVAVTAAARF